MDYLINACEKILRRVLSQAEVSVAVCDEHPIVLDPTELLARVPPHLWIRSAALHLASLTEQCASLTSSLEPVRNLFSSDSHSFQAVEQFREVLDQFLANDMLVDDMRFHAFYFSVYGETIRDTVMSSLEASERFRNLHPNSDQSRYRLNVSIDALIGALRIVRPLHSSDVPTIARDIVDLWGAACGTHTSLQELLDPGEVDDNTLLNRFANVQEDIAHLAATLLRFDVVSRLLLYSD